jgi:hypothetical protein
MAEDVEDILAGRPPRHREGWTPPPVGTGTVASGRGEEIPELSLDPIEARPRRRRRTTSRLVLLLGLVSAAYFYLHPSDWQFWRRAAREAQKSRIADEVRAWWGRVGVESPEAPSAPIAVPATRPPQAAAPAPVPSPSVEASPAPPPSTLAEIVSIPEDDPDPVTSPAPLPVSPPVSKPGAHATPPPAKARPAGELAIEFEHHLKHGNLQVWVDDDRVVNDDFDGRVTHKILSFELRKGLVQQHLALAPGRHSVRVTVRWEDNTRTARISGAFRPGVARKLDVDVSRIGGKLTLSWR